MAHPFVGLSGSGGFAGVHFARHLRQQGIPFATNDGAVENPQNTEHFLEGLQPLSFYFHFAAMSSVTECDKDPALCHRVNATAPVAVATRVWKRNPECVFVFPSTAQVYGPSSSVLDESSSISPISTYAKSKWDGEVGLTELSRQMNGRLLILRLFNHTHSSQSPTFFLPSVYKQMTTALNDGRKSVALNVGNVDLVRDFGALQDLLTALNAVVQSRHNFEGVTVANVCSGQGKNLRQLIDALALALQLKVTLRLDSQKVRKGEPESIVGSNQQIQRLVGWQPKYGASIDGLVTAFLSPV